MCGASGPVSLRHLQTMARITSDIFSHIQLQRILTMAYGPNSDKSWTLSVSGYIENTVI